MSERFSVTYALAAANAASARERTEAIAIEQTVEIPADVIPAGFIADELVGQILSLEQSQQTQWQAVISYEARVAGPDFPQFLNTVFGNSSLQNGVKVIGLTLPKSLQATCPGPRFGIEGLRAKLDRPQGSLLCSVLKPVGLSAQELADLAYKMALGGVDLIKDDHGIANQDFAPFGERISRCVEAVAKANAQTGGKTLFFANMLAPFGEVDARAEFARSAGADGYMTLPGLMGLDATRFLTSYGLPIVAHPAFAGGHVVSHDSGFSHAMMLGLLQRLSGADAAIYPNSGGRFGFTMHECHAINNACREPLDWLKPIFPAPGGGISLESLPSWRKAYGPDVMYLLGGSLLRLGSGLVDGLKALKAELMSA